MKDKIYEVMKNAVDNGDCCGASVLILKDGEEIAYCEYGLMDIENAIPISRDTIYRLYSQTKPITAAALNLCIAQGLVDKAAEVGEIIPEFYNCFVNDEQGRRRPEHNITVAQLLNMTSGLSYPDDRYEAGRQSIKVFDEMDKRLYSDNPVTTMEFAKMMAATDLAYEPGTRFMYGTSADIAGAIVEKVSNMSFGEYLHKYILDPLDMKDTDFYVPADKQHRLSKVYEYSEEGLCEAKTNHLGLRYNRDVKPAFESGGAGLCSTLDDYARFATMLLNNGMYNGKRILPESVVRHMTQGGLRPEQVYGLCKDWTWLSGYTYGNFMRICYDEGLATIYSDKGEYGWDGWLGMFFSNEPEKNITLLFATQQIGVGRAGTLVRKIKNIVMSEV